MKTKRNKLFSFFFKIIFCFISLESYADILEKYIKKTEPKNTPNIQRKARESRSSYRREAEIVQENERNRKEALNRRVSSFREEKKQRPFLFNLSFGANRNHLVNKLSLSGKTSAFNKWSPNLGLKLDYDDEKKYFSNLAFSLGIGYVLFRYYGLEVTASYDQELENYFTISNENRKIYTFLTGRLGARLSYEITSNFILFTSFSSKYSFVSKESLAKAPENIKNEIAQIIDYSYGFIVRL